VENNTVKSEVKEEIPANTYFHPSPGKEVRLMDKGIVIQTLHLNRADRRKAGIGVKHGK
jgi:hypothetical protein